MIMRNIYVNLFEFERALKRAAKNKSVVLYKDLSCLVGVQFWFYTHKAVWSYTPNDLVEEKVFEVKLSYIDNVELRLTGEVR